MNKRVFLIFLLLLVFSHSSQVRKYSDEESFTADFQSNSKKVWLVYRGDPLQDSIIEEVAQLLRGLFPVAIIASPDETPVLKVIAQDLENSVQFDGEWNSEEIVKFALQNVDEVINSRSKVARELKANQEFQKKESERAQKEWDAEQELRRKSDTLILDINNWNTFIADREPWVINFYQANCSACIDLNKDWELISTEFKGKVKVAKLNITEPGNEALEEQIQLQKYPSVRFYKSGPKKVSDFVQFTGVHKRFSLGEWINEKLNQKSTEVDIPNLNRENYEKLCKATKNTCIIVFLQSDDEQAQKKIEQLSLKHLKKPITFMIAKKGEQQAFAGQTGISSYPNVVMMYCKHKKMWRMDNLDFSAVDDAIGEISLGNRNNFSKYKFTEEIV